ncbi:MAG: glutamate formimidoyltransferase [Planctomycetota bacterium]|jgi:glutamate formiminotransferase/formiminotetrahydrofolate cyclodeaminase|nr:glutamate formimidoyltransferase [Planctomycetota bacterium]MDP6761699.1 glutamate formimidoyltransferase [Planctomycetota bacterium]MDP6990187.1 glutamate formimidoyltransferase [Planctomycetota bacterium]
MSRLIECVPNFSEGRDPAVIARITEKIESVDGVRLLDVDPGAATHRTVVTFVGPPEQVIEAAVLAVGTACELIDMSRHSGEHPRFGATDVCPLVPVSGVTMEETAEYARELARRLGEELGVTVFCYEAAASCEERRNLAAVRAGEYEGLEERLADPAWRPDFGPARFHPRWGATAVGARDFLVAYNVNLNTTSTRRANAIAFDVREKGRILREPDPLTGEIVRDEAGEPLWSPGSLEHVKAIGWFIEEYGVAQISMNLTNISKTSLHTAFDEVCRKADTRGVRVTGSELVGLIPLAAMLAAGRHFLRKQHRSVGVSDEELIKIAVRSLGLDELAPFEPREKIIEYVLEADAPRRLVDATLRGFVGETASESPAPGGGSVSAAVGALGAALGTMVANLSSHRRGWDARWEEFSDWAEKGKGLHEELTGLVDADTDAFNAVLAANRLPGGSEAERRARAEAIEAATRGAIEVPLRVMEVALESLELLGAMARDGQETSASDAGVGALCARAAVRGAYLNVRINAADLADDAAREQAIGRGRELEERAREREREVLEAVDERL